MPGGHWEIKYTSKWDGKEHVKVNSNNEGDARAWMEGLARDNNCKAELREVRDDGSSRHIASEGDKR